MTLSLEGISDAETQYTLPLYHAEDRSLNNAEIKISIQKMTYQMANSYREILVYEYERWQPLLDWGNSYPGHLLPIDPGTGFVLFSLPLPLHLIAHWLGRWSNIFGSKFEMELVNILAPLPEGWTSMNEFQVQSTPVSDPPPLPPPLHTDTLIICLQKDPRGWEYAFDFSSTDWYPQAFANGESSCPRLSFSPFLLILGTHPLAAFVRRRIWKKEICHTQNFSAVVSLPSNKRTIPSTLLTSSCLRETTAVTSSPTTTPKFIPRTSPSPSPRTPTVPKSPSSSSSSSLSSSHGRGSSAALAVQLLSSKMLTTKFYYFCFDSSNLQTNDTFTLGMVIPLSSLPLHSDYTQVTSLPSPPHCLPL
jgi:hypothetical protein